MSTNTQNTATQEAYKDSVASVTADAETDPLFSADEEEDIVSSALSTYNDCLKAISAISKKLGNPVPEEIIVALAQAGAERAAVNAAVRSYVQKYIEQGTDEEIAVHDVLTNTEIIDRIDEATGTLAVGFTEVLSILCGGLLKMRVTESDPTSLLDEIEQDTKRLSGVIVPGLFSVQTVGFYSTNIAYMAKPPVEIVEEQAKKAMKPYFDFLLKEMDKSEKAETLYHQLVELIDTLANNESDSTSLNPTMSDEETEEEPENITLATIERDSSFQNHSLGMKALSGLEAIARGEKAFQLSPRSGKSKETYELAAIQVDCEKLFSLRGVSTEHVRSVLQTVYDLRTSHNAEGFVSGGRIWFTTGTILKEMLRTTGGTIREPGNSKAALKVIDAALMAASGARIRGMGPDGQVLSVDYFLNAVRRDKVTYRGVEYRDVWGFLYSGNGSKTLNDYAMEIGQAHYYPLLDSSEPLEFPDVWIYDYLLDMLNEAGGRLYPRDADRAKRTTCTVKRAWETIFEKASPMKALDSRKKKALVSRFDAIAQKVVVMAKNGEVLRNGKPLYVRAKSERDAGRGRGAGAWKNLVLECHADTVRPNVDLLG